MSDWAPGDLLTLAHIGRNYPTGPRRGERHKSAPLVTEERESRMRDSISRPDRDRIRAEARAAAREVMARWEAGR